jgi:rhodanese-related sulfurtransferase
MGASSNEEKRLLFLLAYIILQCKALAFNPGDFLIYLINMENKINLENIIAEGAIIIDVRTAGEYKNGHIKGSLNIPLSEIENAMSWLIKDVPIVLVCESGNRSGKAKDILETNGYKKVYNAGSWNNLGEIKAGGCPVK